jgi:hypothetical protein
MQVNNVQDYVTRKKRQIISATYYTTPPQQKNKFNYVFLSTVANNATTRQRFILPTVSAWGSVPGTAIYTNNCTGCSSSTGAIGTFQTVNNKNANILIRDLTLSMS